MVKARKHKISPQEKKRIQVKTLLKTGREPAKISRDLHLARQTIVNIKHKKGTERKKGSGRHAILDKSQKLSILQKIKHNPFLSCEDLKRRLNLPCTSKTIANYLNKSGFSRRLPDHRPPLNQRLKTQRLDWCEKFKSFCHWKRTVFTDEAGFWIFDNDKRGWFKSGYSDSVDVDHYRGKLNVWAAVSEQGKVGIHVFEGNLTSDIYLDILQNHLIPDAAAMFPKRWEFQQDHHPAHSSYDMRLFIEENLNPIEWPAHSADLSPIENLWPILKRNVRKRQPRDLTQLKEFIYEEWDLIDNNMVCNLCSSIKDRIPLCISKQGNYINH